MTDITLSTITSGYNVSKINTNFEKLEQVVNDEVLHRVGGNNVMNQHLDMNGYSILNIGVDENSPDSFITLGAADLRYYNVSGDKLTGPMDVDGQQVVNLPAPTLSHQAARKQDVDTVQANAEALVAAEADVRLATDNSLQNQILGLVAVPASPFAAVSWHDQVINDTFTIPPNKNAWSFGPELSIGVGGEVVVGSGSFWTIANGELV